MPDINISIKGKKYRNIIEYMCNNCQYFVFIISTYEYIENNKTEEYSRYIKNVEQLMKKLKPYLIKINNTPINFLQMGIKYEREEWEQEKYLYDICIFKITEELKQILEETANSLYEWKQPSLPEDIMFIKDDFIKFSIESNEDNGYIYCNSLDEFKMIEKLGIEFCKEYNKPIEEKVKDNSKRLVQLLLN
ncbi:MAG: hypothetical protein HFJ41_02155 [Clostridia bacterium]|nr:hypothetical protein [Clostridia bacterium]